MNNHEHPQTIAEAIARTTGGNAEILTDAFYTLETHAGNDHNPPMWKELYNALSIIAEKIETAENEINYCNRMIERHPNAAGNDYIEGKAAAFTEIITPQE